MNKQLNRMVDLNRESLNLLRKGVYNIVNSLRHIDIHKMTEDDCHVVDQLIRTLEYFEDIRYYQLKLRKGLISSEGTVRELKQKLREMAQEESTFPKDFYDIEKETGEGKRGAP